MHTLALEIDHAHESAGWIKCDLTIDGERHPLDASAVFPPFLPLLRFVKAVAGQRFPARFYWDEEGIGANFAATAVAEDSPLVHLKIQHEEAAAPWLDADIERETVIQAFLPPVLDISQTFLLAEKEWSMPARVVAHIQESIAKGIPLRSDVHSPSYVEFIVRGGYDTEYLEGQVFLEVWLDDEDKLYLLSHDTSTFWPELIDFFGKIASQSLPAECEHDRHTTMPNSSLTAVEEFRQATTFLAESVDDPQNFRLKILTQWQKEARFLYMDEVVDRRQLVRGFANSFAQFLQSDYQMRPDHDGKTFDLRTLSIEKLYQV
jgi:hypothetical protein